MDNYENFIRMNSVCVRESEMVYWEPQMAVCLDSSTQRCLLALQCQYLKEVCQRCSETSFSMLFFRNKSVITYQFFSSEWLETFMGILNW